MKKKNNVSILSRFVLILLCVIFYSCEGDTIDPDKAGRPLRLQAEIGGLKTRVSGSSWERDDAIGIYMVKTGQPLNASALKQNVKYLTTGSSSFNAANEGEEIILPFDESSVDFISYYPYREEITNLSYLIDLSNQSVQADIDLMYSDNAKGFNSKNPNVLMQFSHQLSKIVLNIEHSNNFDLKDLAVVISNAGSHATFDLATGNISSTISRGNIELRVDPDGSFAEAILLPEENLSGIELWFIIGEEAEVYKFSLADALEIASFEKSTKYTYNVTLFADETIAITDGTITGWIESPAANVIADRTDDEPPIIKGSKKTPFSIAEAQGNVGRTNVWVEGYIVGYFSSSTINSFSTDFSNNEAVSQSNLALADNPNETDITRIVPVQLGSGAIRNALNLRDNPDNFNKEVKVRGDLAIYLSAPGVRDIKAYEFIDTEP